MDGHNMSGGLRAVYVSERAFHVAGHSLDMTTCELNWTVKVHFSR